jgi:uncharacterized delta-60 repeat protein
VVAQISLARCYRPLPAVLLLGLVTLVLPSAAIAQTGALDMSFGSGGKVVTDFTAADDIAHAVGVQSDGKIVAGGLAGSSAKFSLSRYEADGDLDTSFGGDGKVLTDFGSGVEWVNSLAIQSDGKVVAVGGSYPASGVDVRFGLARYNPDGTLDNSFSEDGKVITNFTRGYDFAEDVAVQSDGRIVVVGGAGGERGRVKEFAAARYTSTGVLDATFSGDGKIITNLNTGSDVATGVGIQTDGKIVAGGWSGPARSSDYRFALVRYHSNGTLDIGFHSDGKVTTNFTRGNDYAWDLALGSGGSIVLAGAAAGAGERFAVARYTPTGALDALFSDDGKVITNLDTGSDVAGGVAVQSDGKILAGGWSGPARSSNYSFAAVRYATNGALDADFHGDGRVITNFTPGNDYAWDVALQPDNRIVLAGSAAGSGGRFALARYLGA